jgi:signal transduction histidine kinase
MLARMGDEDLSKRAQTVVETGARTAETMQRIIESLLLFAEAREKDVPFGPVDMTEVTRAALKRFTYERERNGITIILEDNLPTVRGYAPWLEEVVANLISNAIKYIGATNPEPTVRIHGECEEGTARVSVTDNGIGISPQDQERLGTTFARFNDQAIGSGLGISIVLRILKRLGGQLALESELDVGSTFTIELPASSS